MDVTFAREELSLVIIFFYGLLGLDLVIVESVKEELCTWSGIYGDERVRLITLATFVGDLERNK